METTAAELLAAAAQRSQLAAAATRPPSQAAVLQAYMTLDAWLKVEVEPMDLPYGILGSGHGSSLGGTAVTPDEDASHGSDGRRMSNPGGGAPASAAPPGTRKRGPKRVNAPTVDELQAQLEQKQAEVLVLEERNARLKRRKAVLETIIACRDRQVQRVMEQMSEAGTTGVAQAHALLSSAQVALPHQPGNWEEYARMTMQQMLDNFNCLLQSITATLLALEQPAGGGPAAAPAAAEADVRLHRLTVALLYLFQGLILTNPHIIRVTGYDVRGERLDSSPEVAVQHWLRVARVLNLSPEQAEDAGTLFGLYSRWKTEIEAERQRLARSSNEAADAWRKMHADLTTNDVTVQELQNLQRLQLTVDRELCIICLVAEVFLAAILTRLQFAQAVVASHPRMLDSISLLAACVQLRAPGMQPAGRG